VVRFSLRTEQFLPKIKNFETNGLAFILNSEINYDTFDTFLIRKYGGEIYLTEIKVELTNFDMLISYKWNEDENKLQHIPLNLCNLNFI
jgi:hypothetical protein